MRTCPRRRLLWPSRHQERDDFKRAATDSHHNEQINPAPAATTIVQHGRSDPAAINAPVASLSITTSSLVESLTLHNSALFVPNIQSQSFVCCIDNVHSVMKI